MVRVTRSSRIDELCKYKYATVETRIEFFAFVSGSGLDYNY
jgi:hypothetical protein